MPDDSLCTPPDGVAFHDFPFLDSRLSIIEQHLRDNVWLVEHVKCIHRVFRSTLEEPPLVHRSIKAFVTMVPALMLTTEYDESLERTFQAMLRAMDLKDPNLMAQIMGAMSALFPLKGDIRRTLVNARIARQYAEEATEAEAILQAHIRIIQAYAFRNFEGTSVEMIEKAEYLAFANRDHALSTELYLTLAHFYNHQEAFAKAIDMANIAFSLADQVDDKTSKMRARLLVAVSHRLKGEYDAAEDFIQSALAIGDGIPSNRRLGYMLNELAGLRFMQKCYEESEELYLRALGMFEDLKQTYLITLAKHGLGLVWTVMERFEEARDALHAVMDDYLWNGNNYGVADIKLALGRVEARARKPYEAYRLMLDAEALIQRIEASEATAYLLNDIRLWKQRVESGEFGEFRWGDRGASV